MVYEGPQLPREALSARSQAILAELERRGYPEFESTAEEIRAWVGGEMSLMQARQSIRELARAGWLSRQQRYGTLLFRLPHLKASG